MGGSRDTWNQTAPLTQWRRRDRRYVILCGRAVWHGLEKKFQTKKLHRYSFENSWTFCSNVVLNRDKKSSESIDCERSCEKSKLYMMNRISCHLNYAKGDNTFYNIPWTQNVGVSKSQSPDGHTERIFVAVFAKIWTEQFSQVKTRQMRSVVCNVCKKKYAQSRSVVCSELNVSHKEIEDCENRNLPQVQTCLSLSPPCVTTHS